jgi:hypothetical protein
MNAAVSHGRPSFDGAAQPSDGAHRTPRRHRLKGFRQDETNINRAARPLPLLSFALVFALGNVMDPGWAALIVAVIWAIIGAVLYANGRKRLKAVDPMPRHTVETIKEDAQWMKNPTG